jgi:hypothetical protein
MTPNERWPDEPLKSPLLPLLWKSWYKDLKRGFGGRHARMNSPRQLKEVIQMVHINVGSIATPGVLVGGEVRR